MELRRFVSCAIAALLAAGLTVPAAVAQDGGVDLPVSQERKVEAVVVAGSQFAGWSAGPEVAVREPVLTDMNSDCESDADGNHNCAQASRFPQQVNDERAKVIGAPVDKLIGYKWDGSGFVQIKFQVDERFTRFISNLASETFGTYSGADPQLSYVFDVERMRFTESDPADDPSTPIDERCIAKMKPGDGPDQDPVKGLDDNDEVAFLYRDTGGEAPLGAPLPSGITEMRALRIEDPSRPGAPSRFAYVGLAAEGGPTRQYTGDNGYINYVRDAKANIFERTSDGYGNAPRGPHCDADGNLIKKADGTPDIRPRRPRDTTWVMTPRYAFRYDGRWRLRGIRVNSNEDATEPLDDPSQYGPPLIDQWKARAYQQAPGDNASPFGYQTEQDSWGASSVTFGELVGPVRAIRGTWGANSGTNVFRHEFFYPDVIVQHNFLRVHPIPPIGVGTGIYSYWDHSAGVITKFYNVQRPEGVDVDGKNDEVVGNFYHNIEKGEFRSYDEDVLERACRNAGGGEQCTSLPDVGPVGEEPSGDDCSLHCSQADVTDPTLQAGGNLSWRQVSGPFGSMVSRSRLQQVTPGAFHAFLAIPYYRDDARFDDGTGIDPGPHLAGHDRRDVGDFAKYPPGPNGTPREYWTPESGAVPSRDGGDTRRWFQGSIAANGTQVLFAPETDNAFTTLPITELQAEERMVVLPGQQPNVGDRYGRANDVPLQTLVLPTVPSGAPGGTQVLSSSISYSGDTTGTIGGTAHLQANLAEGNAPLPISGANVTFTFQGNTYQATTDEQGVAAVDVPVAQPAGDTTVVARYDGDVLHSGSLASETFTVEKIETSIGFEPDSATEGKVNEQVHLSAALSSPDGPLAGREVVFTLAGVSYPATTNEEGIGAVDVTVRGPAGTQDVSVAFAGDDSHDAASAESTIEVAKDDSAVAFTASDTSRKIDETAHFAARLTDTAGPVSGATLHFDFQGVTKDATTNANGLAAADFVVKGPAGSTPVAVRFDGDASRNASSASSSFTVVPKAVASRIAFQAAKAKRGMTDVNVTLTNRATGAGIAGRDVRFLVNGVLITTLRTGADGKAAKTVKVDDPGGKTFRVEFAGDDDFLATAAQGVWKKNSASGSS